MIADLNYGEKYREEILLKNKIEERISSSLSIPKNQVMLNYGSNSNLLLFFSAFSVKFLNDKKRRLKVLIDYPNYFFTISQLKEWFIEVELVNRDDEMNFPCDKFLKSINKFKPDVIVLTTPNNPTGKPIKDKEIDILIKKISKRVIVLIDRTCINTKTEISSKEILKKYKNNKIIVLHSFSKSHSLSDERLGYLATNNQEIARFLYNKRDLNHNIHAVKKLLTLLNDTKIPNSKRRIIKECNAILNKYCRSKGIKYYDSSSNFALIKLPNGMNSTKVEKYLADRNILIAGGHKIGLGEKYIRLHMSGAREIKSFIKEFDLLLHKLQK